MEEVPAGMTEYKVIKLGMHGKPKQHAALLGGMTSGGCRNLERGVQSPAHEVRRKFLGCHAHFRSRERIHTKYSWKAEPRGPSQKKSRTLSDSVVLVNYNFN